MIPKRSTRQSPAGSTPSKTNRPLHPTQGMLSRSTVMVARALAGRAPFPMLLRVGLPLCLLLVVSLAHIAVWRTVDAQALSPVIHSVDPTPPHCVLRESTETVDRVLTITGESLLTYEERALQFLDVATGQESPLFTQGVDWRHPRRVSIDMAHVHQHLGSEVRLRLRVRIASMGTSRQASNWSDEFILAHDRFTCGSPRPFPPTSAIRGVEGDLWADVIIGKPDFSQVAMKTVVPFKVNNPGGVVVDRSVDPGRAYVWDSGNNRILGIDLAKCYEGDPPCSADIVIGQPSGYDHAACNGDSGVQDFPMRALPNAETLCGIPGHSLSPWETFSFVSMVVDGDGNLYVPDSNNHRVLKYDNPFENDSVADQVWGQVDFTGMVCNQGLLESPTAESLCFHSGPIRSVSYYAGAVGSEFRFGAGVEIDSDGNLWVADTANNRVLRFPAQPDTGGISTTANLVLGQPGFTSARPGSSLNDLHAPSAVRFDSQGWLYVADTANDRVLVFKPPFESGGQAAMTFGSQLHRPTSLEVDPLGRGIWVVDSGNYMVELWNSTGTSVLNVLGKGSYEPDRMCGPSLVGVDRSSWMCPIGGSMGFDGRGNVLVPVYYDTADVFRFPTSGSEASGSRPDRRFFFPPSEDNLRDRKGIESARGVATWSDQLIVSDIKRLMFWNGLDTLTDGRPADGVVGDEFEVDEWTSCCGRIKVDEAGRLWVLAFEGRYFLDVYQLPLTEYSVPLHTMWKGTADFPVHGTEEAITLGSGIHGVAPVGSGEFLWLSDTDNHRVLRIRDPLTAPVVDVILGQKDASGNQCNMGKFPAALLSEIDSGENPDVLCFPGALTIDRQGNLYVSDHALEINGNQRLLVFTAESTPVANLETIYAPAAAKVFTSSIVGLSNLWADRWEPGEFFRQHVGPFSAATWEPAFDSENRMVVGYNAYASPRFVGVYEDPLGSAELPTYFLHDFGSMHYTATFDDDDNLYVGDINRGRVLVYRNPFDNEPQPPVQPPGGAPVPEYPATIQSVSPEPPSCLARSSSRPHEGMLDLLVHGLSERRDLTFEFRKVTSRHREFVDVRREHTQGGGSRISVDRRYWRHMWGHLDRVVMTVRILVGGREGTPITNWSPAFVLAENSAACHVQAAMELGPPAIASVAPGDEQLIVSWTAPVEMGEGDIISYDVRHIPTVADETVSSNWAVVEEARSASARGRLEYVITGLDADTRYDVQVRAVNSERAGPWSRAATGATWSACISGGAVTDPANAGLVSDCKALLAAGDVLAGTGALDWSVNIPMSNWEGVTVRGTPRRLTRLSLPNEGLGGTIPPQLGSLSMLTDLNLRTNGLTGPIPAELGSLTNLVRLNLHTNQLAGPVPDLSSLVKLEEMYLARNMLTGPVPSWLNGMTEMKELWLWGNGLTGTIPDLSGMTSLEKLKLAANNLTGGVPKASALPANLRWLIIQENPLGGTIPDLSGMSRLAVLWLHTNDLAGEIPASHLPSSLTSLNLHSNQLSGEIPDLSDLDKLQWLRLQNNRLSGTIPSTLADMDNLTRLWLHGNMLEGPIPAALGSLTKLQRLWLSDNMLSGEIPEELGELSGHSLVQWRLAGNRFTGCVPAGLAKVDDTDIDQLGLVGCEGSGRAAPVSLDNVTGGPNGDTNTD